MLQQERKMDGTNMHRGPNISVEHGGLWGIQSASGVKKRSIGSRRDVFSIYRKNCKEN